MTFEKAVEILTGFDKKIIEEQYFKGGTELKKKGIYKSEILLNNRLTNAVYKIADFSQMNDLIALKLFNEYLSILTLKQNPQVLRSYGYYVDRDKKVFGFLYECLDDTLEHYLFLKSIDYEKKLIILKKIVEAIIHAHSKGIILMDISPRSIMFDNNWKMRIAKFGKIFLILENSVNRERPFLNSTIEFTNRTNIAPEILLDQAGSSPECDIWSLGVLIVQLLTGVTSYLYEEPLPTMKDSEIKKKLLDNLKNKRTPTILENIDNSIENLPLKAIAIGLLRFEPSERPDIFKVADVLNQHFLRMEKSILTIKYDKQQKEEFNRLYKK